MKIAKISTKSTIADMDTDKTGQYPIKKFSKAVSFKKVVVAEKGTQDSAKDGSSYLEDVDTDLSNLFLFAQGRVRFGDVSNGARGENISGEFRTFTTATANTEVIVPHSFGSVPVGRLVISQDKAGSLYNSTTAWNATNIYVKCDTATVTFKIFLLK